MSSFSLPNRIFTQIYNNNHKTESVLLILTYHILTINFTNEVLHGLSNIIGSILLLAIQKNANQFNFDLRFFFYLAATLAFCFNCLFAVDSIKRIRFN